MGGFLLTSYQLGRSGLLGIIASFLVLDKGRGTKGILLKEQKHATNGTNKKQRSGGNSTNKVLPLRQKIYGVRGATSIINRQPN